MKYTLRTILTSFVILATFTSLHAQQNHKTANNSKGLVIASIPSGALVEVKGGYSFVGRTPFVIPHELHGKYKIKARKEGYESFTSDLVLAKRGANRITVKLFQRTRFKAAVRSFILPGWGQLYSQNKVKGLLFITGQATLGLLTGIAIKDFNSEKRDYELAQRQFNEVQFNLEEARVAFESVQKEFEEADQALDFRNTMLYLTAGFWLYNIFDAIFFFSKDVSPFRKVPKRTANFSGSVGRERFMLTMQVNF